MSTYARTSLRTPLRAAIAVAALAGALLTPTAAFAATSAPTTVSAAAQSANDRYDGEKVLVYKDAEHGVLAVLRNGAEGPEAWFRAVGPNWKPGDVWAVKVIAAVDRAEPVATAHEYVTGLKAQLIDAASATPSVKVTSPDGTVTTYALPKGKPAAKPTAKPTAKPSAPAAGAVLTTGCTVTQSRSIGAGTDAVMTMSTDGPKVTFADGPGTPVPSLGTLDRKHPKLPASAGIYAEILNPYGTAPQLKSKVEGGAGSSYAIQSFPKLPKGCELNTGAAAKAPSSAPSANTSGQTSVVPKGAVAAGAEFTERSSDGTPVLIAGGAGLAVAGAAGYVVLRRRSVPRA
ncbi:hypothetical protein ABZX93_02910 [Streptomyces sp. NPDC006632]|uniref:hypothetical protein n=1 Tax=Streptomyces sp. NPDC006632 TaxID=3157182 RepID=UPI00339DD777